MCCLLSRLLTGFLFLHGFHRDGLPVGRRVNGYLLILCVRQALQDAPDVLVYLQAFQERWLTATSRASIKCHDRHSATNFGLLQLWHKYCLHPVWAQPKQDPTHLQTGHRHVPRSQFNCKYDSKSKHCNETRTLIFHRKSGTA